MERTRTLVQLLSSLIQARTECMRRMDANENAENAAHWYKQHTDRIETLAHFLPSGSGFDNGTSIDLDASNADKIVLVTDYHHMNDNGMYVRWTTHTITVRPAFVGIDLRVSGRDYNDTKDYIAETFHHALCTDITESSDGFKRAADKVAP